MPVPDLHRAPEINYMLHCQGCHRPDGSGVPGAVPDLRGEVARFLASPGGREFLIRVPGVANAPLSDRELGELVGWVVQRFDPEHVPADFRPYGEAEVAKLRAQKLSKVKEVRAAILAPAPEADGTPDRAPP
jgi:hypothetical protein